MRGLARSRIMAGIALTTLAIVAAPGCSSTVSAGARGENRGVGQDMLTPERVSLNGETRSEIPARGLDDPTTLAGRAERDVAFLADHQDRAETPPPTSPSSPEEDIIWTNFVASSPAKTIFPRPSRRRSRDITNPSPRNGANPAPLARPEDAMKPVPLHDRPGGPGSALTRTPRVTDTLTTQQLDTLLVDVRRELFRLSTESSQPLREMIAIAAMALIDPDLELPDTANRDLSEEELVLLEALHAFFIQLGQSLDGSTDAEEAVVNEVLRLQKTIVQEPELNVTVAAFCYRVGGFGNYSEFDPYSFLAHSAQKLILYLEVEDFTSELNKNSQWVTELSQQLQIYSERDGIPVWSEPWQAAVDVTSNQRHDFYTVQKITLPSQLSVGRYSLKIRIRDEKSGAEAEASIPFDMVADPKLAARVPEK